MPAPFERSPRSRRRKNTLDVPGTVVVMVQLRHEGAANRPMKGNISRSFSIRGQKVSVVAEALERFIFGDVIPAR